MNQNIEMFVLTTCCFTLACQLYACSAEATGSMTTDHVTEGTNYRHLCDVAESPEWDTWWIKNETGSEFFSAGRFLELYNISRTEAGDYICQIGSPDGHERNVTVESLYLDVQYPAKITFTGGPSPIAKGGNFSLTCTVTDGHPSPRFGILRGTFDTGSLIVKGHNKTLKLILPATCSNTGVYSCLAGNGLGHYVGKSVNIKILCKKRAPVPAGNITYVQEKRLGDSVTFVMRTQAFPKATYTWLHNNVTITGGITDNFYNTTLEIKSVELSNYGNFTLILENSEGRYVAHYELLAPKGHPEPPTDFNYFNPTYNTVGLVWFTGFDYGLTANYSIMHWSGGYLYMYRHGIMDSNNASSYLGRHHVIYNMTDLSSDTVYEFSVVAHNAAGYSNPSNKIKFTTKQYIDKPLPTTSVDGFHFEYKLFLEILGGVIGLVLIVSIIVVIRKKQVDQAHDDQRSKIIS